MRSAENIRAAKTGFIAVSMIYCLLGLFLMFKPGLSVTVEGTLIGIAMVVFGMIKIICYFAKDLYRLAFQHDLACGLLLIVLGIVVLAGPAQIMESLCMIIGIVAIGDGLLKIQTAMDARRFGLGSWITILITAVAACAIGIMLTFQPGKSVLAVRALTGLTIFAQGVMNLLTAVFAVKVIRNQYADMIDITDDNEE